MMDGTGILAGCRLLLSEFDPKVVHGADVKDQTAAPLSSLRSTTIDYSPLEDDVPILMMTKAQPHGGKPETNKKVGVVFFLTMVCTPQILPFMRLYRYQKELSEKRRLGKAILTLPRQLTTTVGILAPLKAIVDLSTRVTKSDSWSGNQI